MKRCPKCYTNYSDDQAHCSKCNAELEFIKSDFSEDVTSSIPTPPDSKFIIMKILKSKKCISIAVIALIIVGVFIFTDSNSTTSIPTSSQTPSSTAAFTPTPKSPKNSQANSPKKLSTDERSNLIEFLETTENVYNNLLKRISTEVTGNSISDTELFKNLEKACIIQHDRIKSKNVNIEPYDNAINNLSLAFSDLQTACRSGITYYEKGQKDGGCLEALKYSIQDSKDYYKKFVEYKDKIKSSE